MASASGPQFPSVLGPFSPSALWILNGVTQLPCNPTNSNSFIERLLLTKSILLLLALGDCTKWDMIPLFCRTRRYLGGASGGDFGYRTSGQEFGFIIDEYECVQQQADRGPKLVYLLQVADTRVYRGLSHYEKHRIGIGSTNPAIA